MQKLPLGCSDNNSMSKVYLCGLLSLYRIDSWFWWYAESSWWDLYKINSTRINMISMCSLNMWGVFSSFFCLTSKQSPEWGTMLVDCSHHSRGSILIESIRHFRYQSAFFSEIYIRRGDLGHFLFLSGRTRSAKQLRIVGKNNSDNNNWGLLEPCYLEKLNYMKPN
jgi:hypothetical protein